MSASTASARTFFIVLLCVVSYHVLFVAAGHYSNGFLRHPQIIGHILFIWVPLAISGGYFAWSLRDKHKSKLLRSAHAFVASVGVLCISIALAFIMQVSLWGM